MRPISQGPPEKAYQTRNSSIKAEGDFIRFPCLPQSRVPRFLYRFATTGLTGFKLLLCNKHLIALAYLMDPCSRFCKYIFTPVSSCHRWRRKSSERLGFYDLGNLEWDSRWYQNCVPLVQFLDLYPPLPDVDDIYMNVWGKSGFQFARTLFIRVLNYETTYRRALERDGTTSVTDIEGWSLGIYVFLTSSAPLLEFSKEFLQFFIVRRGRRRTSEVVFNDFN